MALPALITVSAILTSFKFLVTVSAASFAYEVKSFKKEKAGEFLAWSVKALLIIYIVQTIIRMIILEIQQWECDDGIYFDLAGSKGKGNRKEEKNIKPILGVFDGFTNDKLFDKNPSSLVKGYEGITDTYTGFKRLLVNFIAAATFAEYDWH